MSIRFLLLVFFLLTYASVSTAAYSIQPGDEIAIILPGEESLSEPFMVDRAGTILLPELGAFSVKGFSEGELKSKLRASLSDVFLELKQLSRGF